MYVVKTFRKGAKINVSVLRKDWSEPMGSHMIREIGSHKFFLRFNANRWGRAEIIRDLVKLHELEINDG